MEIRVEHLAGPIQDARELVAELDEVLGALYEPDQRHGLTIEQVFEPNVRFFVARLGDAAVGCGALALFDGYAEVKRMYTREAARGRGVGKALLARIEEAARDAGKPVLRLETGIHQRAAIGLYEGYGFRRCGAFGHYAGLPPRRIRASVFYEKPL
ncbi:MAG TPA: GNAT family N-acetyltransferase [Stellaceae bacterium]